MPDVGTGLRYAGLCLFLTSAVSVCSIPGLLEQVIKPPMSGPGLTIYIQIYNTIFFFVFASVLYAVVSPTFLLRHSSIGQG